MQLAVTLTDFGAPYLAQMQAAILAGAPRARLLELDRTVPPGDVRRAAFELLAARGRFPEGTVFVCVVDPGVGTARRILLARGNGRLYLAPDNGLLSWLAREEKLEFFDVSAAARASGASGVFHGRDVFAPLCAGLLRGLRPGAAGPRAESIKRLPPPLLRRTGNFIEGEVLFIDGFGNCITSLPASCSGQNSSVAFKRLRLGKPLKAYGLAEPGARCAVISSSGFVELAINGGNFSALTGARAGDKVRIYDNA